EDRGMSWRIQVEPDNVADLVDQQRVIRQLTGLAPMQLQPERVPDPTDRHAAEANRLRHVPRAPMRRARPCPFQPSHTHLLKIDWVWTAGSGSSTRITAPAI